MTRGHFPIYLYKDNVGQVASRDVGNKGETGGFFPPSSSSLNRTAAVFHPDASVSLDVPLEIIQRRTDTNVCHRPLEYPLPKESTVRFRYSNPSDAGIPEDNSCRGSFR